MIAHHGGVAKPSGGTSLRPVKKATVQIFEALSHRTRLRCVELLGKRERTVEELSRKLKIVVSAVHHHLHVLRDAGLLHPTELHGRTGHYTLNKAALRVALGDLGRYCEPDQDTPE